MRATVARHSARHTLPCLVPKKPVQVTPKTSTEKRKKQHATYDAEKADKTATKKHKKVETESTTHIELLFADKDAVQRFARKVAFTVFSDAVIVASRSKELYAHKSRSTRRHVPDYLNSNIRGR